MGLFECNSLPDRFAPALSHAILPVMPEKRLNRPRDPIQLGKLIVDIATGQIEDRVPIQEESPGAKLAKKGGNARAAKLSAKRRREIALQAAQARWGNSER
jgi:hypothetical protein